MQVRRFYLSLVIVLGLISLPLYGIDDSKVQEFTLDNGLRVITYEMHTAPVIYSRLTYNVGAKYEPYGQTGISHIVEHMMFKGTKRFPKGTIAELISANGGVFNAYTSSDITVYYELLPKNKIELAFDIESERMHKCEFDRQEFASEIQVIAEERKQRTENSARGKRREELNTLIYKSHPYRNPVIGWMHDIQHITRDQAYQYYQTHYTPNNATLVLCGDFETANILETVRQYFGNIPAGPALEQPDFFRVDQEGKKILHFRHSDILNEEIKLYFSAPGRFEADGPALYVAGKILCGRSATSRLYKRLVRKEKLCKSVAGGARFSKDPSTFSISADLLPEASVDAVEKIIWQEIDSLARVPVIDYDLQKIKNKIRFNEITDDQYISSVGNSIALYENYIGWEYINKWNKMVTAVSKDDIMRVTNQYMHPDKMVICYSHPDSTRDTSDSLVTVQAVLDTTGDEVSERSLPKVTEEATNQEQKSGFFKRLFGQEEEDVRELYRPDLKELVAPNPIKPLVDSLILDNGVPVYYLISHDFPTLYIMGFIETGRLPENAAQPGTRQFLESMLMRGTKNYTYDELLEERSFTPYQLVPGQSWSKITFQGYSLIEDSEKMLDGLYEIMAAPAFPEEQMEKIRPRLVTNAENLKKTERMKAFYGMFEDVFAGHQYAVQYAGDADVLDNLQRKDLVKFYEKYYSPEQMTIVAVGDFEREWLQQKLGSTIGQWQKPSGSEYLPFSEQKVIEGKTVYAFNNPEYKQCRVDIAFNPVPGGITKANPDLETLRILEHILCGSSLTSRMGVELRDKRGLCYGVRSNLWVREHGGYWNIRTNTDREYLTEMIKGMFEQIELIQQEGITDEELEKAKARKISLLTLHVRTMDDIGGKIYSQLKYDRPLDYFDKRKERILSVTKEDVKRVANQYLDTQNYILAVSGNMKPEVLNEFK